jgi:mono/diheme cytochrome c family protein
VAGTHAAALVLPAPGDWTITIHGWRPLVLPPVKAVAVGGAPPAPLAAAEKGARLFVSKGCATCHTSGVAPALVPNKHSSPHLARILEDPSILPPKPEGARMPNLGLEAEEIASLVAMLNPAAVTARR